MPGPEPQPASERDPPSSRSRPACSARAEDAPSPDDPRGLVVVVVLAIRRGRHRDFVSRMTSSSAPNGISRRLGFRVDWDLNSENWMTGGVCIGRITREIRILVNFPWAFQDTHDPDLLTLSKLLHLQSLKLDECDVSEEGLSALSALRELEGAQPHATESVPLWNGTTGLRDGCLVPLQV